MPCAVLAETIEGCTYVHVGGVLFKPFFHLHILLYVQPETRLGEKKISEAQWGYFLPSLPSCQPIPAEAGMRVYITAAMHSKITFNCYRIVQHYARFG